MIPPFPRAQYEEIGADSAAGEGEGEGEGAEA